ncbi:hypothetical protein MGN70_006350 [Eutypa lata]|nr:hypothetical protein MGN70_006350 [Eutypa lata]
MPSSKQDRQTGSSMRFISVDNVLQHASQIPSGLPRGPPRPAQRTVSGVRRTSGGGLPNLTSRTGQQNMPSRTTRISEKLVLLPETIEQEDDEEAEALIRESESQERPLKDEELDVLRKRGGLRGKTQAERLPKPQRAEKFSRLTAYCTAQAYKMKSISEFLRKKHDAKTKLYDDCLYTVYHTPLLPGVGGYRVRSRPILKTPGTGKTVLDLEIERNEQRDEHMGYYEDYAFGENGGSPETERRGSDENARDNLRGSNGDRRSLSPINRLAPDAKQFAELFIYSYGVAVFWNFTEQQEKAILADITFAENETGVSLVTRPLDRSDVETEEFHFEYSHDIKRPRVFNDMITLMPRSDHMVKLTISHAIAQSTKLCFFEERLSEAMINAAHIPKRLAETGELAMGRTELVKIQGRLFKSRVDINLCKSRHTQYTMSLPQANNFAKASNILDVPNFFWDSEPNLHPLYVAIREYLEIDLRTKVVNERCRVFLDLAEILSDSVADSKMSAITYIIIVLIVISILVTVTEVALRFGILSKGRANSGGAVSPEGMFDPGWMSALSNATLDELKHWAARLNEQQRNAVCGTGSIGTNFAEL